MKKLPRATERKKKYPQIKKKIYIYGSYLFHKDKLEQTNFIDSRMA